MEEGKWKKRLEEGMERMWRGKKGRGLGKKMRKGEEKNEKSKGIV